MAEPAIYSDDNFELHFIGNNTLKFYEKNKSDPILTSTYVDVGKSTSFEFYFSGPKLQNTPDFFTDQFESGDVELENNVPDNIDDFINNINELNILHYEESKDTFVWKDSNGVKLSSDDKTKFKKNLYNMDGVRCTSNAWEKVKILIEDHIGDKESS